MLGFLPGLSMDLPGLFERHEFGLRRKRDGCSRGRKSPPGGRLRIGLGRREGDGRREPQGERDRAMPLLYASVAYLDTIGHAQAAAHAALLAQLEASDVLPPALRPMAAQQIMGRNAALFGAAADQ